MTAYNVSGKIDCTFDQYNGSVRYPVLSSTLTGITTVQSSKNSVDSGEFQPGTYRVNPYSISREEALSGPGQLQAVRPIGPPNWFNVFNIKWTQNHVFASAMLSGVKQAPSLNDSSLSSRALQKAYAKVGSAACGQGENLGELRETLETLRNPLGTLRKYLKSPTAIKFGNEMLKFGKVSSSTWLEMRYGLRPIYLSIMDIATQLEKGKKVVRLDRIYSAKSNLFKTETKEMAPQYVGTLWSTAPILDGYVRGSVEVTEAAHASVQYRFLAQPDWGDTWGFKLQYIPETAWELTRLSFVVDWFLTIGPWIQSWRINPNIQVLGDTLGVKTTKSAKSCKFDYVDITAKSLPLLGAQVSSTSFCRTIQNGIPARPYFRWLKGLSTYKTVDLLSIILQYSLNYFGRIKARKP